MGTSPKLIQISKTKKNVSYKNLRNNCCGFFEVNVLKSLNFIELEKINACFSDFYVSKMFFFSNCCVFEN